MNKKEIGKIAWIDLTVPDAVQIRDFYREVVGAVAALFEQD